MTRSVRWVGLAGPTASGKSRIALALAEELPIEIVSVDSAQVYRGLTIGSAKPGAAERAAVPHHLIDIRDPQDAYSAAQFVADASAAIDAIAVRGRLALTAFAIGLWLGQAMDGSLRPMASGVAVWGGLTSWVAWTLVRHHGARFGAREPGEPLA